MFARLIFIVGILISQATFSQGKDLNLPDLGDRVSGVISLEQEKLLGQSFVEQVYAQAPLLVLCSKYQLLLYKSNKKKVISASNKLTKLAPYAQCYLKYLTY